MCKPTALADKNLSEKVGFHELFALRTLLLRESIFRDSVVKTTDTFTHADTTSIHVFV